MVMGRDVLPGNDVSGMMEWSKQDQQPSSYQNDGVVGGACAAGMYVKVMTDEQMELLRRQISAYAAICEQLVEMHKAVTAQQDLAGMRLGNLYCDSLMASSGHKITARQRWTPTPMQLQILERIFDEGNGTPTKEKIKGITMELSQHGPISEANVYNWFQNRRARSKRKQLTGPHNGGESEAEAEVESPKEKKTKPANFQIQASAETHCLDMQANKGDPVFPSECGFRSSGGLGHLASYESVSRMDQLIGKMEVPESFSSYQQGEEYNFTG
ncbi:hypothetical protein NMG60_11024542 [Bertholletia excelsa]